MATSQGNLFAQVIAPNSTPTFLYQLPAVEIAYWSTNVRISGHDTDAADIELYVGTTNDPQAALRLDAAQIQAKGSYNLECLLRSGGDCFFLKTNKAVTLHIEGIYEPEIT